jgi:methylamine---glutamate N-methyltransferase subunit A
MFKCGYRTTQFSAMCGIAGLFAKSPDVEADLGRLLKGMLQQLADRGPDSVGLALYRRPVISGTKLSLLSSTGDTDWTALASRINDALADALVLADHSDHAVLHVASDASAVRSWLSEHVLEVTVIAAGEAIELHKRAGRPETALAQCGIGELEATHGIGHTRMATESRVTTAGAHPFSTGDDLCLVHNGSLSNHNRVRRDLLRHGIRFATENDSEVAAGYLTWRLQEGDTLERALELALEELDGFFTFAVGTRDGFAVLRDPIACKPAVMAETDSWVAIASEYRAIATLPDASDAEVWEPEPAHVYSWSRSQLVA